MDCRRKDVTAKFLNDFGCIQGTRVIRTSDPFIIYYDKRATSVVQGWSPGLTDAGWAQDKPFGLADEDIDENEPSNQVHNINQNVADFDRSMDCTPELEQLVGFGTDST
jgi:hypothetical protein